MDNQQPLHLDLRKEEEKILIVDDSPSVLRALERQLDLAGHEYLSARNGSEAVEVLEKAANICLIISDWRMPGMDGMELLSFVRQTPLLKNIPFLMVTGVDSTEEAVLALKNGANDYITKPYHPGELLARVDNLIKMWKFEKTLHGKATFDELTGLYNRNSFQILFKTEISRARRYGTALSLVIFDIDSFEKINEQHGHRTGECLLQHLGAFTRKQIRNVDYACRSGGEKFALILPNTDLFGATVLAERLCEEFRHLLIPVSGKESLNITCSFGVAELIAGKDDGDSLMARTDSALSESKKNGRNRVTVATE